MSLFETWTERLSSDSVTKEEWDHYLAKELNFYKDLLAEYDKDVDGETLLPVKRTIQDLCKNYKLEDFEAVGVLDGINESLQNPLELESLNEESEISFIVDLKTLYLNMLKAKATWLSSLPEWDAVLSAAARKTIKEEYVQSITARSQKEAGRNDPCPCGSGKKYKKCCGVK